MHAQQLQQGAIQCEVAGLLEQTSVTEADTRGRQEAVELSSS